MNEQTASRVAELIAGYLERTSFEQGVMAKVVKGLADCGSGRLRTYFSIPVGGALGGAINHTGGQVSLTNLATSWPTGKEKPQHRGMAGPNHVEYFDPTCWHDVSLDLAGALEFSDCALLAALCSIPRLDAYESVYEGIRPRAALHSALAVIEDWRYGDFSSAASSLAEQLARSLHNGEERLDAETAVAISAVKAAESTAAAATQIWDQPGRSRTRANTAGALANASCAGEDWGVERHRQFLRWVAVYVGAGEALLKLLHGDFMEEHREHCENEFYVALIEEGECPLNPLGAYPVP